MSFLLCSLLLLCPWGPASGQDLGYRPVPGWGDLPAGWNFGETAGVAVDSRGHVYVFNRGPHPLVEFAGDGQFVRSIGEGEFTRAHAVRIDRDGNIWVVDVGAHVVLRMNPRGRVTLVLGRRGQAGVDRDHFNQPTDVAFTASGDFYVSDGYGNSRVIKFSREGKYLAEWGKKGTGEGEFNLPHTVAADAKGRVYVGDRENHRLQVFDSNGRFLAQWKQAGSPFGLDLTPDQRLFVIDGYDERVIVLNLDGQVLARFGGPGKMPGQFGVGHAIAVGRGGEVYVAEVSNWRAQKFARK